MKVVAGIRQKKLGFSDIYVSEMGLGTQRSLDVRGSSLEKGTMVRGLDWLFQFFSGNVPEFLGNIFKIKSQSPNPSPVRLG